MRRGSPGPPPPYMLTVRAATSMSASGVSAPPYGRQVARRGCRFNTRQGARFQTPRRRSLVKIRESVLEEEDAAASAEWRTSGRDAIGGFAVLHDRTTLAGIRPRQQRRPGAEGAQEEDAARRDLSRNAPPQGLRETVREAGAREGRSDSPDAQARPQAGAARRLDRGAEASGQRPDRNGRAASMSLGRAGLAPLRAPAAPRAP